MPTEMELFGREAAKPALNVGSGPRYLPGWVNLERYLESKHTAGFTRPPDLLGDAHVLPVDEGSFRTVFLRHVIEHLVFPLRALQEARRVLEPGGRLRVEVPNALKAETEKETHIYSWTPDTLHHIVDKAGFRQLEYVDHTHRHPPYEEVAGNNHGIEAVRP